MSLEWLSSAEIQERRSDLFTLEQRRQRDRVGRMEKIEIRFQGLPNDTTLIMNKGLSTPFNCAQRKQFVCVYSILISINSTFSSDLSERHCNASAIALINGNIPWDMHRPLEESSTLQLLNFHVADPHIVNRAFWRSCSFLLGAALQQSVKDEAGLQLHSFPSPNVKSGSFVHDISLAQKGWQPSAEELRAISAEMIKLAGRRQKIERLEVSHDLAFEMFKDNPYKREQLPSISKSGKLYFHLFSTYQN